LADEALTTRERVEKSVEGRRRSIGQESEPRPALYPIEHEAVARFCTASDDFNPLFLDPAHGSKTRHGANLAPGLGLQFGLLRRGVPGSQAGAFGLPGAGGRTTKAINLGTEWEFFAPIKVGDRISATSRLAEIYIKPIRIDPLAVWSKSETIYRNQDGVIVAVQSNLGIAHRTPEQVAADEAADREIEAARGAVRA
jgi:acyl dehydratase